MSLAFLLNSADLLVFGKGFLIFSFLFSLFDLIEFSPVNRKCFEVIDTYRKSRDFTDHNLIADINISFKIYKFVLDSLFWLPVIKGNCN